MTLSNTGAGGLVGRTLGHYQLSALLGAGGMAEIYRAHDDRLNREVAIKVLPVVLAADPAYVTRFRSEAQHVANLRHPNIVPVFDYGEQDGLLYIVMPLLPGSLRDRIIPDNPMPITDAIALTVQIAGALEAAHAQGIVHRDVKPENILLDANGDALLTDFGIARELSFLRQPGTARTLSATGLPIGTPEYMAPEQLRDGPVDQRADVYALGSILYELLTTHAPHEGATPYEVAALVLTAPITPPSQFNPKVSPELDAVVTATLSSDPAQRPQSVAAFAQDLAQANQRGLGGLLRATVPVFRKSTVFDGDDRATNQLPAATVSAAVATPPRQRSRAPLRIGLLVVALALLAGLSAALLYGKGMLHSTPPIAAAKTATATTYPTSTLAPTSTTKPKSTSTSTPKPTNTPRPAPTATPVPPLGATVAFVRTDTRTQGNWNGVYGSIGSDVFEDKANLPPSIAVTPNGKSDYTWSSNPSYSKYPEALQRVEDSSQRIAATWYSFTYYTIDVNITDGKRHQLSLYCLDWGNKGRAETITISDAATHKVLNTQNVTNFGDGVYLVWNVSGHITITITRTGYLDAVSSGIFFD
ncbi:MAG: serine/threonine protein kinase [Ktedonobacterales bacterium]|nr:MAG: serine/threonine protein kinase [Ktedonobacterales bacterium]